MAGFLSGMRPTANPGSRARINQRFLREMRLLAILAKISTVPAALRNPAALAGPGQAILAYPWAAVSTRRSPCTAGNTEKSAFPLVANLGR
jgi:hypothetical protein